VLNSSANVTVDSHAVVHFEKRTVFVLEDSIAFDTHAQRLPPRQRRCDFDALGVVVAALQKLDGTVIPLTFPAAYEIPTWSTIS